MVAVVGWSLGSRFHRTGSSRRNTRSTKGLQHMARTIVFVGLVCTFLAANVSAQTRVRDVKIRGYVTEFRSPTSFDIEDYRISRDEGFVLDFENASPEITFSLNDIRVGVELEVRGQLNEATGELKAKSIRVDLEQFKPLKQTAFVSTSPEGHRTAGWQLGWRTAGRWPDHPRHERPRKCCSSRQSARRSSPSRTEGTAASGR